MSTINNIYIHDGDSDISVEDDDLAQNKSDEEGKERGPERDDVRKAHEDILSFLLQDAGRWTYGVSAIEIWRYNSNGRLEFVPKGSWAAKHELLNKDPAVSRSFRILYDSDSPNYEDPENETLIPGEGLPGALWSHTQISDNSSSSFLRVSLRGKPTTDVIKLKWHDILGLSRDPDQPFNARLKCIADSGFRKAAGVRFQSQDLKGVVIFLAQESVDAKKLSSTHNEEFMISVSKSVGSLLALHTKRKIAASKKLSYGQSIFSGLVNNVRNVRRFSSLIIQEGLEEGEAKALEKDDDKLKVQTKNRNMREKTKHLRKNIKENIFDPLKVFLKVWVTKMGGSTVKPYPPQDNNEIVFILFTAFLSVFFMLYIKAELQKSFGYDYDNLSFIDSQLASLAVMVFALWNSPAAQPRSIVMGRTISMFVGMVFGFIKAPESMELGEFQTTVLFFSRFSLTVAVSSAFMAKFRVEHPPGGSLAAYFTHFTLLDQEGYKMGGILLLHDIIFILVVAMLNNLIEQRQYPSNWGYIPNRLNYIVRNLIRKAKNDTQDGSK